MTTGQGPTDFTLDINAPVVAVRCLVGPTYPLPSRAETPADWRIISHLTLNYLSLVDTADDGAEALRDVLKLYCDAGAPDLVKQIDGIRSVASRPVVQRMKGAGPVSFVRGLEVSLELSETAYRGTGIFLLGAVLERFIGGYVSVNSFTETVITSMERGEVMRWPARSGNRPLV
jgi:type VI secretion system protein ImpG